MIRYDTSTDNDVLEYVQRTNEVGDVPEYDTIRVQKYDTIRYDTIRVRKYEYEYENRKPQT